MKAAVLHEHGAAPRLDDFEDPVPSDGHAVAEVGAAGINHLDLLKASGGFYTGPPPLPSVVGSDGVGRLADGRRVFFDATVAPHGAMAERTLVREDTLLDVPEGVPDEVAAALGNSGLGAWLALEWRARLRAGETVLVLGATGAMGNIAVQAAKVLGAGRVVAAARAGERLQRTLERGADAVVELDSESDPAAALQAATGGADVIIDPLWGRPGLAAMEAAGHGARHVEMGQMAGTTLELPAPLVRGKALNVLGFAFFHAPLEARRDAYAKLMDLAARRELQMDIESVPLSRVREAWERQREGPHTKLVVVPGA